VKLPSTYIVPQQRQPLPTADLLAPVLTTPGLQPNHLNFQTVKRSPLSRFLHGLKILSVSLPPSAAVVNTSGFQSRRGKYRTRISPLRLPPFCPQALSIGLYYSHTEITHTFFACVRFYDNPLPHHCAEDLRYRCVMNPLRHEAS